MIVVDDEVGRSDAVEGHDEKPEERPHPEGQQRQHRQNAGGEIAVGGGSREADGEVRTDDARNDEDQPEEAEAVQRGYGALRPGMVHGRQPGQHIGAQEEEPGHIAEDELDCEDGRGRHVRLL